VDQPSSALDRSLGPPIYFRTGIPAATEIFIELLRNIWLIFCLIVVLLAVFFDLFEPGNP
jgi:hypothetical protein